MYPSISSNGITYTPGGVDGTNDDPSGLRTIQCTDNASATALLTPRRRFDLLDLATSAQESGNACAIPCPGQIPNGTGWRGGNVYPNAFGAWPASWGRTQFTTATFLTEVIRVAEDPDLSNLNAGIRPFKDQVVPGNIPGSLVRVLPQLDMTSEQILQALGIQNQESPLLQLFRQQYQRAENLGACWNRLGSTFGFTSNGVSGSNNPLAHDDAVPEIAACQNFSQQTGLTQADFDLMVTWWRYKRASQPVQGETTQQLNSRLQARTGYLAALNLNNINLGATTNNETLNAWQTKSIMSDAQVEAALLGIFNSQDNFDALSDQVLWRESTYMSLKWPNHNELDIARSFAYYHNAGRRMPSPSSAYVTSFVSHWTDLASQMTSASVPCFSLDPTRSSSSLP